MIIFFIIIGLSFTYLGTEIIELAKQYVALSNDIWSGILALICIVIIIPFAFFYSKKSKDFKNKNNFISLNYMFVYGIIFVVYGKFDSFYSEFGTNFLNNFFILLLSILGAWLSTKVINSAFLQKYKEKRFAIPILLIILFSTFSVFGLKLFLENQITLRTILLFCICCFWIAPFILGILSFFEQFEQKISLNCSKTKYSNMKIWFSFFSLFIIIWGLYWLALYPAYIPVDGRGLLASALTNEPIKSLYQPPIVALYYRLIYSIIPSPIFIAWFQIVLFSSMCSTIFYEMYRQQIKLRSLYLYAILFAVIPSIGIMVGELISNSIYGIFLIWTSFVLFKIIKSLKENQKINIGYFFSLMLSLPLVYNMRGTGFLPFIVTVISLLVLCIIFKKKNFLIATFSTILISIIGVVLVQGPLYGQFTIRKEMQEKNLAEQSVINIQLTDNLQSILYYDGELPIEAKEFMLTYGSKEEWISTFDPYYSNYWAYPKKYNEIPKTNEINSELKNYFFSSLQKEPKLVIENRLRKSELVWNMVQPLNADNERNALTTTLESQKTLEDITLQHKPNILTEILMAFYYLIVAVAPLDIIVYRVAPYLILLLISIVCLCKRNKGIFILCLCPILIELIGLILAMNWPSYRVAWMIPACTILIIPLLQSMPQNSR